MDSRCHRRSRRQAYQLCRRRPIRLFREQFPSICPVRLVHRLLMMMSLIQRVWPLRPLPHLSLSLSRSLSQINSICLPLTAPPPSYQSLFGQVRDARKSAATPWDFVRKLFIILIGTRE
jgi:hypothetical protein